MSHVSVIRPRHLVWLPAALLMTAGVLSVLGVPLTPNGRAATGTTTISANVLPEISLDLAQGGPATCGTIIDATDNAEKAEFGNASARIPISASGPTALGTCNMTFGTNNGSSGASLSYKSARVTTPNRTFCTAAVAANCAGANTYYTDDDGGNATLEQDKFGIRVETPSTCDGTQVMNDNFFYGAPLSSDSAQTVCTGQSANPNPLNDGYVQISFHVNTATIPSGDYNAEIVFTATAA